MLFKSQHPTLQKTDLSQTHDTGANPGMTFLQVKFILACFRLDQPPPAHVACLPKQVLAGHLQQSQYKPHTTHP